MNTNKSNNIIKKLDGILNKDFSVSVTVPDIPEVNVNIPEITVPETKVEVVVKASTDPIRVPKSTISTDGLVRTSSSSGRAIYAKTVGSDGFIYGYTQGKLYRSGDSLETTEVGEDFSDKLTGNKVLETVTKTWKGYVVVISDKVAYTSEIWFSETFIGGYTKVLDVVGRIIQNWTVHFYCKSEFDTVLLAGTRNLVVAQADPLYMSRDGETWTQIFESKVTDETSLSHWHHACYDPYSGRIWAAQGDTGNAIMWYSENLGTDWHEIPKDENLEPRVYQPTLLLPFANRVTMGSDITRSTDIVPSLWSLEKDKNYLKIGDETFDITLKLSVRENYIGDSSTQYATSSFVMDGDEGYIKYGSIGSTNQSHVLGTGDGGNSWHHLLTLHNDVANQSGIIGVDKNGNLIIPYLSSDKGLHHIVAPKVEWVGQ